MSASHPMLSYTDIEIRSYLPSGWGIVPGGAGRWSADQQQWAIDVYDGADNTWKVAVSATAAANSDRLRALKESIELLSRKALGRKSILTG